MIQMPPALVIEINGVLVVVAETIASGTLSIIMSAKEPGEFEGQGHFQGQKHGSASSNLEFKSSVKQFGIQIK